MQHLPISSIPLRRLFHCIFILDDEAHRLQQASLTSIVTCSLPGEQESISACLDQAGSVRTGAQPCPGNAYCWHQLLDEAVQVLREGAALGTAAQVDGEFSQRKHIPSAIAAPKAAQVRQTPG